MRTPGYFINPILLYSLSLLPLLFSFPFNKLWSLYFIIRTRSAQLKLTHGVGLLLELFSRIVDTSRKQIYVWLKFIFLSFPQPENRIVLSPIARQNTMLITDLLMLLSIKIILMYCYWNYIFSRPIGENRKKIYISVKCCFLKFPTVGKQTFLPAACTKKYNGDYWLFNVIMYQNWI